MVAPGQQPPNGKQLPQNGAKGQQPPQQKGNQQQDKQKNEAREALLQYYQAREQIDWRNERIQEESHTGVMVAFFLKPSEAQQLALPGGEPIDEIHMTLCYLGDKSQIWNFDKLEQAVSNYAKSAPALQGNVSGIGRFLAVPDGEQRDAPGSTCTKHCGILRVETSSWKGCMASRSCLTRTIPRTRLLGVVE